MESGNVVKSIYEFKSDVEGELELHVGDIIQVIERVDRHWLRGTCNGRTGNFPSGFAVEVKVPQFQDSQAVFAAISTFIAQEPGDLPFDRSDLIIGIEAIDANWWRGKVNGEIGIFPITHVWALDTLSVKKSSFPKQVSMVGRVKMDMKAQLSEEIDLKQGDHVLISEMVDKDWFRGTCNGKTGVIPSAFVTIIDKGELNLNQISSASDTQMENSVFVQPNQSQEGNIKYPQNMPEIDVTQPSPPIKAADNSWLQACNESNNNHYGYDSLNSGITPYGRTLTSFRGEFPNELTFGIGELVRLMRHVDDYWLEGEIDGKIGLFPRKCIDVIVDCPDVTANSSNDKGILRQVVLPNDTFGRVLYEFLAEVEGDLPLKEGDTITLLRKINDNWYEAISDDGKMGLCPANYVEIIGSTRERSGSGSSVVSDWRGSHLTNISGSSFDQVLKPDVSSDSGSSLSRSMSITESPTYTYDNSFNSMDGTGVRQKPRNTLRTQMSLPTLSSSNLFSDTYPDVQNKNASSKPQNSRRSAPAATFRFPDIVEDTGTYAESQMSKSLSINLSQFEIEKEITDKLQQKERYERCRDKLKHQVERETDGNSPGALEFKREISQYDRQIQSLQTEIDDLKSNLKSENNEASGSSQFKTEEEKRRDAQVEIKRKEEDARKKQERKRKNMDQRQCIITELLQTERDYLQDLKICQSIFLSVPEEGKSLGIDMVTLFGNLDEVIDIASRLLRHLTKCCLDKTAEEQIVGECFVNLGEDLKEVYGHYCRNHDEVNPLLKKYETNPSIQEFIYRGVERMKSKTNCFDLQSVLIKPVQRILKYPLLLNELLKCTEDSHVDKVNLVKAVDIMAEVAMAINEFKRRKDLVFKYRKDTDTSLSSRFSKLTLHSLRKKSSRFSVMLSSSLGLTSVTKDEDFLEAEKKFQTVEKTLKIFLKDLTAFTAQMQEFYAVILNVAEDIGSFYQERKGLKEVDQLRSVHRIIFTQFWEDFKISVDKRVFGVVKQVLQMFHGPRNLVQKRHDKLLDYDAYESKLKSTKDANKARALQEEVQLAKNTYEALNTQLLDELPQLCSLSIEILHDCIVQFLQARRIFIGRSAKEMLNLMDLPTLAGMQSDIMEVFKVKHNLVVDALVQMSIIPKHLFPSAVKVDGRKQLHASSSRSSIGSGNLQVAQKHAPQSPTQKTYIKSQYPMQSVFLVNEEYAASDLLDISLVKGDIVGVIKKKDPMDNPQRWFVDNGSGKGFVPCRVLSSLTSNPPMAPSRLSYPPQIKSRSATPSPDVTRYCNLPSNDLSQSEKNSSSEYTTNWNLLNVSIGSKTSSSGQPSPRYSEVDEFDPLSVPNANLSYEEVPNLDHRYEMMPGEEASTYGEIEPLRSSSPKSVYENVPGEQSKDIQYYYAKYAFSAAGANQLSMAQGQVVLLVHGCDLHGNPEWYFVEDRYGNKGYVPANYLVEYEFSSIVK